MAGTRSARRGLSRVELECGQRHESRTSWVGGSWAEGWGALEARRGIERRGRISVASAQRIASSDRVSSCLPIVGCRIGLRAGAGRRGWSPARCRAEAERSRVWTRVPAGDGCSRVLLECVLSIEVALIVDVASSTFRISAYPSTPSSLPLSVDIVCARFRVGIRRRGLERALGRVPSLLYPPAGSPPFREVAVDWTAASVSPRKCRGLDNIVPSLLTIRAKMTRLDHSALPL